MQAMSHERGKVMQSEKQGESGCAGASDSQCSPEQLGRNFDEA
jgi:hypothetical protein